MKYYFTITILLLSILISGNLPAQVCGNTWTPQVLVPADAINCIYAVNYKVGWTGANSKIYRTVNGGENWNPVTSPVISRGDNPNTGIFAFDSSTAFVASTGTFNSYIFKTTNGGVNWNQVYIRQQGYVTDVRMINATTGFACGTPDGSAGVWIVLKTTDGGNTWAQIANPPLHQNVEYSAGNSLQIIGNDIFFLATNGKVFHSTDLGLSWSSSSTGLTTTTGLHFNSAALGIAGFTSLVKTTNGGLNWTPITLPGSSNTSAIEGYDNNFWVARNANIYKSTDAGVTWSLAATAAGPIVCMDFYVPPGDCPAGWAGTLFNGFLKLVSPTGISNSGTTIPGEYKLSQNFPNPFNPVTQISFSLPRSGFVTLKIYDISGKEISSVVNNFEQAGNYQVDFNSSELSSGVYYYRINVNDFTDTKKMMLVK
jgi:photosystem II stability/assembly factor-like uncharacterized protein